jgi:hypothetical protein
MEPVLGPLRAELEHLRGEVGRLRAQLVAAQRR